MDTYFTSELEATLTRVRAQLHQTLDPLIPNGSVCALIDFPHYSNVGDSAIWLGEITYLKQRKCQIRYVCDSDNYNYKALTNLVGKNIILINGGGNFGDLYPRHQKLRERVLNDFPENRIIQLPQSIYFADSVQRERSQAIFSAHQDFQIIVRDKSSYNFAKQHYTNSVHLCPDMAMMLDLKPLKDRTKSTGLVVLSRTDKEKLSAFNIDDSLPMQYLATDWLDEPEPKYQWLYDWAHLRLSWNSKVPQTILSQSSLYAANAMAKERLERGLNILGQGEFVITDRLHALLLSWLGKTPVSFVDNNYGKLSNFIDAWLTDSKDLQKCNSFKEAVNVAVKFFNPDPY